MRFRRGLTWAGLFILAFLIPTVMSLLTLIFVKLGFSDGEIKEKVIRDIQIKCTSGGSSNPDCKVLLKCLSEK